jgi:hypothetical protein
MTRAWKVLEEAGVPLGAARPRTPPDPVTIRAAFDEVALAFDSSSPVEQEALHAWLCAFASEWPEAFSRTLGPLGRSLLERLEPRAYDAGRHVKLRRIAVSHLARMF